MENLIYWSQLGRPRYSSNTKGIPVQPIHRNSTGIKPAAKVVKIPVHFIGSDPDRSGSALRIQNGSERSGSALRIQKVFRGFLVRKSVKRIMLIRKEVEDVERKLLCRETAELIHRDEKERLRVNETLMSLLFKLDSIRGVDFGVRELRKAVIRKAISLQEMVDSIVFIADQITAEEENQCDDSDELSEDKLGKSTSQSEVCDVIEQNVEVENQAASTNDEKTHVECERDAEELVAKREEVKEETDCPMPEVGDVIEGDVDEHITRTQRFDGGDQESRRNRELLEKMVEKNEKMMRMMNELCQRNETQTRILNSLTQRVDQLERTFLCDRLKTKKKKRHPA